MKVKALRSFVAVVDETKYHVSEGDTLEMPASADWLSAGLAVALPDESQEVPDVALPDESQEVPDVALPDESQEAAAAPEWQTAAMPRVVKRGAG